MPELSPALATVRVSSTDYDEAAADRDRLQDALADAAMRELTEGGDVVILTAREEDLTARITRVRDRAERWEADVARLTDSLREVAASSYMSGAGTDPLRELDTQGFDDRAKADVAVDSLATRQSAELETARRGAERNREAEARAVAVRDEVRTGISEARRARDAAAADKARLAVELVEATKAAEDQSRLATVDGAGFPLVVLDAYWKAAEAMRLFAPTCGIPWWALAGIGRVESGHGTHAGAEVRADGSLTKRIIGIPLTGFGGTAAIGDSDGGLVDGDPTVDRAAGPMQFIPTTWVRWGRDGDGNGTRDIQNIYDAALAAAAYLCASGPLTDDAGLQRAYFSYNHSLEYVADVLDGAKRYALQVQI
ncbi:lytic murein transglycosylase [Iamia majanohamensis]|uniref:Lytic murein transglycosylase n=1 Tax=Iamia majanohamensis TaxID=467976 RepID=A0AAE9Y9T2_9ACTN|nr:lytic murein transglycosylase [Iamia majanohamensis]WCO65057.1 lytic murein transglycosylase [Iamia majanohamensis]